MTSTASPSHEKSSSGEAEARQSHQIQPRTQEAGVTGGDWRLSTECGLLIVRFVADQKRQMAGKRRAKRVVECVWSVCADNKKGR